MLAASFLSYSGPFDFGFRYKMIYEHWFSHVNEKLIPCSEEFRLERILTSDVEISGWNSEGLPGDELSI